MLICWEAKEYLYLNRTKSSPHLLVQQRQLAWFYVSPRAVINTAGS